MRALLVAALVLAAGLAGCADPPDTRANLVPYPRMGDVATYAVEGALVDLARWENARPLVGQPTNVRLALGEGGLALDGARALHPTFLVTRSLNEGGGFVEHARLFVSPVHQAVVQSSYKLSQDQSVLAFDERGYPWLWGASVLFGEELRGGATIPLTLPDNLGIGDAPTLMWGVAQEGEGWRLSLLGNASIEATLWLDAGEAWPTRVRVVLKDDGLAPFVRGQGAHPVTMDARLADVQRGGEPVPPRNRGDAFVADDAAARAAWDGEKPPDGAAGYVPYLLAEAVADAKLLDPGLREWLAAAKDPRVYRATFKEVPVSAGPAGNVSDQTAPYWLVQFVDQDQRYYEVEVERVQPPLPLAAGVPRIARSGPAEAPKDPNHGWFPRDATVEELVTLSEGVRIVREVFGATRIEIFLRSFADPAGYSYFIDGGMEPGGVGRYTVVYNPATGFLEQATGPVTPRVS